MSGGSNGSNGSNGSTGVGLGTGIPSYENTGQDAYVTRLAADIKICEQERPGLALGDYKANGGWSFMTFDDTVWPFIYRCMKARGHNPNGPDYSANGQSNFYKK